MNSLSKAIVLILGVIGVSRFTSAATHAKSHPEYGVASSVPNVAQTPPDGSAAMVGGGETILTTKSASSEKHSDGKASQLKDLQKIYSSMKIYEANFKQVYESNVGVKDQSTGKIYISKPGKIKFVYDEPKGKYMVMDGEKVVLMDPLAKQAQVIPQGKTSELPAPVALLFGDMNLETHFNISVLSQGDQTSFELSPKSEMPGFKKATLILDSKSSIQSVAVVDENGGTNTLTFSDAKFPAGFSKSLFSTKIPKGVAVVTGSPLL